MSLATTYQLVHKQLFEGQSILNVYFYDHIEGDGFAGDLILGFIEDVVPAINALQTTYMTNSQYEAINLGVTTDFYTLIGTGGGLIGDIQLPPSNALSFTFKSADRAIRPGGKRICGIPENAQENGHITNGTYQDNMELLRLAMFNNIVKAGDTWKPVLVKRIKTAVAGTVPQQYTYRLPRVGDPFLSCGIPAVLTTYDISSQVSRKQ